MSNWSPIPKRREVANNADIIRNVTDYFDSSIDTTFRLETPPSEFTSDTRLIGKDLHYTIANVTAKKHPVIKITATWTENGQTRKASALIPFEVGPEGSIPDVEEDDIFQWIPIPPIEMFSDNDGNISGTVLPAVDRFIENSSGATVAYAIASKSNSIRTATLNNDNDILITATGLTRNINATVSVSATATIDGTERTISQVINVRLIFQESVSGVSEAASTADSKATAASEAASTADSKATAASEAASTADSKATAASEAASTADSKATAASTAASTADSKATAASEAASTADSKATAASEAASTA
ncbi:MAG: hypothetical protein OXL96_13750, partial [Candidatus Poribacteria bacterium]|nr:hypothetical protein [Candidatus Poribacteria bacterium]